MISISINDGSYSHTFTLRAELEQAMNGIVTEVGSPYENAADLVFGFLKDNAFFQWMLRYPGATLTAAIIDMTTKQTIVRGMQNSDEINAAQAVYQAAYDAFQNAINEIVGNPAV